LSDQTVTPDQAVAAVLPLYEAFTRRDMPAALACMADDIEWHESGGLPWGGLEFGPAAVAKGIFTPALARVPDLTITPEEIVSSGDTVMVIHRYQGTAAATGGALDLLGVGVWTVRDGLIARYRQFVDTVRFRVAIAA
jgi:ketosteroid isomerase-like protein